MDRKRATEILGSLRPDDPVMTAIRHFVHDAGTRTRVGLFQTDFSKREYAVGKAVGFMEALSYIDGLPNSCAEQREKEKQQ